MQDSDAVEALNATNGASKCLKVPFSHYECNLQYNILEPVLDLCCSYPENQDSRIAGEGVVNTSVDPPVCPSVHPSINQSV